MVSEDSRVHVGSWVTVKDGELEEGWRIVPLHDADARRRMISEDSPLACALIGHAAGDEVTVRPPRCAPRKVTILDVG